MRNAEKKKAVSDLSEPEAIGVKEPAPRREVGKRQSLWSHKHSVVSKDERRTSNGYFFFFILKKSVTYPFDMSSLGFFQP